MFSISICSNILNTVTALNAAALRRCETVKCGELERAYPRYDIENQTLCFKTTDTTTRDMISETTPSFEALSLTSISQFGYGAIPETNGNQTRYVLLFTYEPFSTSRRCDHESYDGEGGS